ncbi:MFS transporter [Oceanicella actignis]|uniref:MFS transporter, DHA1 family, tetracycline resistance protein n=1 Tax=Oceanicella actignis TaxID=1189325 RepID=A0A1M7RR61_9RHOB|nr:MFS transporter [Oceanicella actignis]SET07247.1 MFS transporter, DHA1 family, tetracycline resistance protein [Oceanicella actignis]SHN48803.1 MFS transporter, DHA1 family, tetracycline resistance protein [Oceanicella actignis]
MSGGSAGRPALGFVFAAVMIDAMGIGLVMPVMPALLREVTGLGLDGAARWGGALSLCYAAMQFLCAPLLGALSDRRGRRPVLLTSLAALGAAYLAMAAAGSIWTLLAARLAAGAAAATHSTAYAYVADVTAPERRAARFGLLGAAFGLGFVLGPALGGALGELGPRAPFLAAAALAFAAAGLGLAAAPESLPPERRRRRLSLRGAHPLRALARAARMPGMGPILGAVLLYDLAIYAYPSVWSFHVAAAYGWSAGQVGMSLAAYGLVSGMAQAWLIRPALARLGERRTALMGLGADALGALGLAAALGGWSVYALMPLLGAAAMAGPAMTAMLSRRASEAAQGELQGVLAALSGAAAMISPPVMTWIFDLFVGPGAPFHAPGAPFALAAALAAGAALLLAARA